MTVNSKSFLGRLYRLNFDFTPNYYEPYTNLCHFMRVILIWLPLKIAVVAGLIAAAVVWWEVTAIFSVIAVVGLIATAIFLGFTAIGKKAVIAIR